MNLWGKIIGTVTGYALDGAAGAVIGGVAGHFIDMYTGWAEAHVVGPSQPYQPGQERRNPGSRYVFTLCVVTLGAKLAKVDGTVSKVEISAFKEVFRIPPEEVQNVATMFDRARATATGYEPFARRLGESLSDNHGMLDEVVSCLFHVATSDGALKTEEIEFIRHCSKIFGFSDSYFQRRLEENLYTGGDSQYGHAGSAGNGQQQRAARPQERAFNPYTLLGLAESSTDQEIKIKHRKLVRENHPDSMVASGKTKAEIDAATAKLARINAAYDQILKERHI